MPICTPTPCWEERKAWLKVSYVYTKVFATSWRSSTTNDDFIVISLLTDQRFGAMPVIIAITLATLKRVRRRRTAPKISEWYGSVGRRLKDYFLIIHEDLEKSKTNIRYVRTMQHNASTQVKHHFTYVQRSWIGIVCISKWDQIISSGWYIIYLPFNIGRLTSFLCFYIRSFASRRYASNWLSSKKVTIVGCKQCESSELMYNWYNCRYKYNLTNNSQHC